MAKASLISWAAVPWPGSDSDRKGGKWPTAMRMVSAPWLGALRPNRLSRQQMNMLGRRRCMGVRQLQVGSSV